MRRPPSASHPVRIRQAAPHQGRGPVASLRGASTLLVRFGFPEPRKWLCHSARHGNTDLTVLTGALPAGRRRIQAEPLHSALMFGAMDRIQDLGTRLTEELRTLIRLEIQLVQAEMTDKAKSAARALAYAAIAGVFAFFAVFGLLIALIWGIGEFMPIWLSAVIVTLLFLGARGPRRVHRVAPRQARRAAVSRRGLRGAEDDARRHQGSAVSKAEKRAPAPRGRRVAEAADLDRGRVRHRRARHQERGRRDREALRAGGRRCRGRAGAAQDRRRPRPAP